MAVTLNRSKSGITQWVPARTATPWRSITVATSWAMGALHLEGDDGPLPRAVPISAQRVDFAQPLLGVGQQIVLMGGDALLADRIDVVDRGAQPDRLDDRRRAGLELVRRVAIGDPVAA